MSSGSLRWRKPTKRGVVASQRVQIWGWNFQEWYPREGRYEIRFSEGGPSLLGEGERSPAFSVAFQGDSTQNIKSAPTLEMAKALAEEHYATHDEDHARLEHEKLAARAPKVTREEEEAARAKLLRHRASAVERLREEARAKRTSSLKRRLMR